MNYLQVFTKPIIVQGAISYSERSRANSIIRLKKAILEAFGELKKEKNVFYKLELYPNYQDLIQRIEQIKETKEAMPMLLFLLK